MEVENIKIVDIKDIDIQYSFFHYTNKKNIANIDKDGLVPQIGNSATGIEISKKNLLCYWSKRCIFYF